MTSQRCSGSWVNHAAARKEWTSKVVKEVGACKCLLVLREGSNGGREGGNKVAAELWIDLPTLQRKCRLITYVKPVKKELAGVMAGVDQGQASRTGGCRTTLLGAVLCRSIAKDACEGGGSAV
jgi:hypothetical protein